MQLPLPPSREGFLRNARLLRDEWRAASWLKRYFIASQLASGTLLGLCSLASIAAGVAGLTPVNLGLLAVAAMCFVHSVGTWSILKRRFQVRYEVW